MLDRRFMQRKSHEIYIYIHILCFLQNQMENCTMLIVEGDGVVREGGLPSPPPSPKKIYIDKIYLYFLFFI